MSDLPPPKFVPGGIVGTEGDLRVLKDVVAGESVPRLASDITASASTFYVGTGEGNRLADGNFSVIIGTETIFIGTRSGDTCMNLTRGADGSVATAHVAGERVNAFISAVHHNQLVAEVLALEAEVQRMFLRTPVGPNLVTNPSFETDAAGWELTNAVRDSAQNPPDGDWCIRTNAGSTDSGVHRGWGTGTMVPVTPGSTVIMAVDLRVSDLSQLIHISLGEYDATPTWTRSVALVANDESAWSLGLTDPAAWKRLYGEAELRPDTAFLVPIMRGNRPPSSGGVWAAFDNIFIGEVQHSAFV